MISRSSTFASTSSQGSSSSTATSGQVLRKTYKDPSRLREYLDYVWGSGQYTIKVCILGVVVVVAGVASTQPQSLIDN